MFKVIFKQIFKKMLIPNTNRLIIIIITTIYHKDHLQINKLKKEESIKTQNFRLFNIWIK